MRITKNPTSEARTNRGTGNTGWKEGQYEAIFGHSGPKMGGETGTIKDEPIREDYALCRDLDKTIKDYKRYKNPRDRERIKDEYFGKQEEYRKRQDVREYAQEIKRGIQ